MEEKVKVCFDKDYKIRVLDPVKFQRGEVYILNTNIKP